jgi:ubiquinol-cytochrome c reductase cytochrome b subunit
MKPWNGRPGGLPLRLAAKAADGADERYHPASNVRKIANKVFPDHFSFLFGEIALYSFVVLLLSGVYLALWFDPSMSHITYQGVYHDLSNVDMSKAFASDLDISFTVRGGLFVRQVHHWAALLFLAAITIHMLRIFFTGAFRKPREMNWAIGASLLLLGIFEGFLGYSLGDDMLSGTGLRIADSIVLTIPVIGTWLQWAIFGSEYPGTVIIPRMFAAHVVIVPGIILALIAVHLAFVWFQKHTQFPGRRQTERNVVGSRLSPVFSLHSMSLALSVIGVTCLLGGLVQINPIWHYGPYEPAMVQAGSQPDWYMAFVEGSLRLWPPTPIKLGPYFVPAPFWSGVVIPVGMVLILMTYPLLERWLTKDHRHHNLLQRPRDNPGRTSVGMMALVYFALLVIAAGDDIIAEWLDVPIEELVWIGRIGVLVLPPLAFLLTYRTCLRLQTADRIVLERGLATGVVIRTAGCDYLELRQPLRETDEHGEEVAPRYEGATVPNKINHSALASTPTRSEHETLPTSSTTPDPPRGD